MTGPRTAGGGSEQGGGGWVAARRPGPIGWLFIGAVLLGLVAVISRPDEGGGGDRKVALWGDSLAWEAQGPFKAAMTAAGGTSLLIHTYGGTAPCDWLDDMRKQSRRWHPTVAVLSFSGNTGSRCMKGRDLVDAYRDDVTKAVARLTRAGSHVLLVEAPPRLDQPVSDGGLTPLDQIWRDIARDLPDTTVVPAGRAVTMPDGRFARTLPCLPGEQCEPDGAVTVRSPDGVHFCPRQMPPVTPCPVTSPGADRYGRAMAAAAVAALGPAPSPSGTPPPSAHRSTPGAPPAPARVTRRRPDRRRAETQRVGAGRRGPPPTESCAVSTIPSPVRPRRLVDGCARRALRTRRTPGN